MRHHLTAAAVAAIIAASVTLFLPRPATPPQHEAMQTQTKESAYDRVMRTGVLRCGYIATPSELIRNPQSGDVSGFMADVMTEIGQRLHLTIEWTEEVTPETMTSGLQAGRYDALCSALPRLAITGNTLGYTTPLFYRPKAGDTPAFQVTSYGLAYPIEASALGQRLNTALNELNDDDIVNHLLTQHNLPADEYLHLAQPYVLPAGE